MAAFARRRPHVPFSALRLHALRDDFSAARKSGDDDRERRDLWGWTSLDSAAAACLALRRPTPGHAVYNIVAARTGTTTPSEELARRWYRQVPLRAPMPTSAGFYSTAKALAELAWDARDEHPAVSDREYSASTVGGPQGERGGREDRRPHPRRVRRLLGARGWVSRPPGGHGWPPCASPSSVVPLPVQVALRDVVLQGERRHFDDRNRP
jgi:hypothetical protein